MKIIVMLVLFILVGCKNNIPFVHKPPIQQGNLLEQKDIDQLTVGMTRKQVDYVLGAPISHDTFGHNRYDYVYYYKEKFKEPERRTLTIYFDDEGKVTKL